jgi:hypothetical protein
MANRCRRQRTAQCRVLLAAAAATDPPDQAAGRRCPRCRGAVETVEVIVPRELRGRLCRRREPDTS